MTIYNLGSINADLFYRLDHLPGPGETLAANEHSRGLGGKGANQSIAAARAGAHVVHIGSVGADGVWAIERLKANHVDTSHIGYSEKSTGHAVIYVDASGENSIVIWPGANQDQSELAIENAISGAGENDTLLLQNETNAVKAAAAFGKKQGMRVIYSAAPFEIEAAKSLLGMIDILVLNEVEAMQLTAAIGSSVHALPVPGILVTKGAAGAEFFDTLAGKPISVGAVEVDAVDTTGAGDTFAGYFAAGLDRGMEIKAVLHQAAAAAALKVTRYGTADAIPEANEVAEFLKRRVQGPAKR